MTAADTGMELSDLNDETCILRNLHQVIKFAVNIIRKEKKNTIIKCSITDNMYSVMKIYGCREDWHSQDVQYILPVDLSL